MCLRMCRHRCTLYTFYWKLLYLKCRSYCIFNTNKSSILSNFMFVVFVLINIEAWKMLLHFFASCMTFISYWFQWDVNVLTFSGRRRVEIFHCWARQIRQQSRNSQSWIAITSLNIRDAIFIELHWIMAARDFIPKQYNSVYRTKEEIPNF